MTENHVGIFIPYLDIVENLIVPNSIVNEKVSSDIGDNFPRRTRILVHILFATCSTRSKPRIPPTGQIILVSISRYVTAGCSQIPSAEVYRFPRQPVHCPQMPSTAQQLHRDTAAGVRPCDATRDVALTTSFGFRATTPRTKRMHDALVHRNRSYSLGPSSWSCHQLNGTIAANALNNRCSNLDHLQLETGSSRFKSSVVWIRTFHKYLQVYSNLTILSNGRR